MTQLDRRSLLLASGGLAAGAALHPAVATAAPLFSLVDLRVDRLVEPFGVETPRPRLSWRLSGEGGSRQVAYRLRVARSREALAADQADLWDSGRVESGACVDVAYGGGPLASRQVCVWQVDVWDQSGRVVRSAPATWEMGLLDASDWSAGWVAAEDAERRADRAAGLRWIGPETGPASVFRLSFDCPEPAELDLILATSMIGVELAIDGAARPLARHDPNAMGPPATHEQTLMLGAGRHVLAVKLGGRPAFLPRVSAIAALLKLRSASGEVRRLSGAAGWRIAETAPDDWRSPAFSDAGWSPAALRPAITREPWPPMPAMYLRRSFDIARPVRKARLYVTALGGVTPHLNGGRIDDARLAPGPSDFRARVLYRALDVTAKLKVGSNVLGLHVGDGWYGSYFPLVGAYAFGPPPRRAIAQLEIEYEDGSHAVVTTDDDWRVLASPVLRSQIFEGETVDARRDLDGWDALAGAAYPWEVAQRAAPPPARLTADAAPPVRAVSRLAPKDIRRPAVGVRVVDFGQNFAGWARLTVQAQAGDRLELRFAELLTADGRIDQSNLRGAAARDVLIARGGGAEVFEPEFTYHGFRYVELTGPEAALDTARLDGVVAHTDLAITADLSTGNPIVDQLWRNTVWSQRSNFVAIPTDCPQRDERLGWTGDAAAFWDAAAFNMDIDAFTRRFLLHVRDGQTAEGAYPDFAPAASSLLPGKPSPSPGWADAGVILPWTIWRRYGDTAVIEENLEAMARYFDFIRANNPDHVWRKKRGADFADWLALDAGANPGAPTTPKDLVGTACWARSLDLAAQMAAAVGRPEAAAYRAERAVVGEAFAAAFVQGDGTVGNGSQTGYILALRFGLVPPHLRAAAGARLVADIERRGRLLSTGFLGTPHALDVLADLGEDDLVYDLLFRTEFPSWGYMVKRGATTIWERWNGDAGDRTMNSFNHYALGAVCGFVFRRVVGIDAAEPGFSQIDVRPLIHPKMGRASATYQSAHGKIAVGWEVRPNGRYVLSVEAPPNTSAVVAPVGGAKPRTVGPGVHRLSGRLTTL